MLPLFKRGGKLFVGTSNPTHSLDEIKFHTNLVVEPILVDEDQIRRTLEQWHASHDTLGDALGGDDDGVGNLDVSGGDEDISGAATPASMPRATTQVVRIRQQGAGGRDPQGPRTSTSSL